MELILVSAIPGLKATLDAYGDLSVVDSSNLGRVERLIAGEQRPDVVYLDDTRPGTTMTELWQVVLTAQRHQVRVLLNFQGNGRLSRPIGCEAATMTYQAFSIARCIKL